MCVCVVGEGWGGDGGVPACASASLRACALGCVLMIHQVDTADAGILSTYAFKHSLLRNDVHLEDVTVKCLVSVAVSLVMCMT